MVLRCVLVWCSFLSCATATAQTYEWRIDRIEEREREKQRIQDSLLVHLDGRWSVGVSFGKWYAAEGAINREAEGSELAGNLTNWQLTGHWHFAERWAANFTFAFQLKKDVPSTPDIQSVLSGGNIEVEGSAVVFVPLSVGVHYYLRQQRFRPYVGFSTGVVSARSIYILAEGNLSSGINRTDFSTKDQALLGSLKAGFVHRTGLKSHLSMNIAYSVSNTFSEPIAGYLSLTGLGVSVGYSILF